MMDMKIKTKLISSLEKVFPDKEPVALPWPVRMNLLK